MAQYSTNAIYEYLKANPGLNNQYLYIQDGNWVLVYGNENAVPKLFLIVTRMEDNLDSPLSDFETQAKALLSDQGLPIRILRFKEGSFSKVVAISNSHNIEEISIIQTAELYNSLFSEYGLSSTANIATKAVNDATSSTFHVWQRSFLSGGLIISDVDLIVYNAANTILRIYELKRSFIALNNWRPYEADYPNFRLLRRAFPLNIPLVIIFNLYQGTPRVEDLSYLRVFKVVDDSPTIQRVYQNGEGTQNFNFTMSDLFK